MVLDSYIRAENAIRATRDGIMGVQSIPQGVWEAVFAVLEKRTGKIVLSGVGKSGYISMKIAATLTSLGHFATFMHPVEAMHGDSGSIQDGDVIIALSFSGNTKELIHFLEYVKNIARVMIVGVTGNQNSHLGKLSDSIVPVVISEEGSPHNLAPMASTTAMLVVGDAIAAGITSPMVFSKHNFARFHPSGTLGLSLASVQEKMALQTIEDMVIEDTPLKQVLVRMTDIGKGLIGVVTKEGVLIGAIADGDIRRFFLTNTSIEGVCARDVMNESPKCVEKEHTLLHALSLMETLKITNVFVVNENNIPIGILHMHDIIQSK